MGKITVKHYLNKTIKPKIDGNVNTYPLYVQIIADRVNYKMKSNFNFWNGYIKEADFNSDLIQNAIKSEKEQLEKVVAYLIDNEKKEYINADSFKRLSANLWDYLSNNFWRLFVKEGEALNDSVLPNAFYNSTFYDINEIISFTKSEIEMEFSEVYRNAKIGMDALSYAILAKLDKNYMKITVFDFLFGEGREWVLNILKSYHGFHTPSPEQDYQKVLEGLEEIIFVS